MTIQYMQDKLFIQRISNDYIFIKKKTNINCTHHHVKFFEYTIKSQLLSIIVMIHCWIITLLINRITVNRTVIVTIINMI